MDELTHKFVAILNEKIPVGNLMNALGHMAAGLGGSSPNLQLLELTKSSRKEQNRLRSKNWNIMAFVSLGPKNNSMF